MKLVFISAFLIHIQLFSLSADDTSYQPAEIDSKTERTFVIGIDLGGTKTAMAVIDSEGKIHEHKSFFTLAERGAQLIVNELVQEIQSLCQFYQGNIVAVGVGVAGQVDKNNGSVIFAPNLRWTHVPLQKELESIIHLPVVVVNDLAAITMGEWLYGAGRGSDDIVCLFVGTGIGSAMIAQGKLFNGFSNSAGEIGHTTILINGDPCTCGNRGCLETLAAGWAIAKKAKDSLIKEPLHGEKILEKANGNIDAISTKSVIEAFHEQDPLAIELVEQMRNALIVASINITNAFNPQRLILGGGVIKNLPTLLEDIETGIQERALKAASAQLSILKAELDDTAGIIGAGACAWEKYNHSLNKNL
jgi:glucokinase